MVDKEFEKSLKIHEFPNGILYIENAFPLSKEFLKEIDDNNLNEKLYPVIPKWDDWVDGHPVKVIDEDGKEAWEFVFDYENKHRGYLKRIDWDYSLNDNNKLWPRKDIPEDYDDAHQESYPILQKINSSYEKVLQIWADRSGNEMPNNWITKNYLIKKYKIGGDLGTHIDKNVDDPLETMDWTMLIYLNDDYDGGDVFFVDHDLTIKPSAGSVLFFSCLEPHFANTVTSGEKAFIFSYIHLDYKIAIAMGEDYRDIIDKV